MFYFSVTIIKINNSSCILISGGPTPTINRIQVQPQPEDISPEKRIKPGPSSSPSSGLTPPGPSTSSINRGAVGGKPMTKLTLQEKQLQDVQLRQKQYRDAAIEAKKRGDINQAREYLRISKGFDSESRFSMFFLGADEPPGHLIN